jgi:hypothetical protein
LELKKRLSYAIEVAYWNLQNFYYSVDGGFEFEHKKIRIYSEIQTGIIVTGVYRRRFSKTMGWWEKL